MTLAVVVLAVVVVAQPILFGLVIRVLHRDHVAQTEQWRTERTELLNRVAHPATVIPTEPAAETEWVPPSPDYERVGSIDLHVIDDGDQAG